MNPEKGKRFDTEGTEEKRSTSEDVTAYCKLKNQRRPPEGGRYKFKDNRKCKGEGRFKGDGAQPGVGLCHEGRDVVAAERQSGDWRYRPTAIEIDLAKRASAAPIHRAAIALWICRR
jgi:hypothetical protein